MQGIFYNDYKIFSKTFAKLILCLLFVLVIKAPMLTKRLIVFILTAFLSISAFAQIQYVPRLSSPSPIHLDNPVGTIDGELSASSTGAATYTIPIKVPPGVNGMEPKLSLVYNSQSGNGILGYGWGLSGLSAINRSGRDVFHDRVCKPIEWNNNDQFYMDGSKLYSVDGEHGNHNTVYTTEQEVGTRVTQQWMYHQTNSPSWFSAQTKEGTIMHYGELGNARLFDNNNNEILSWKLNSVEDIDGNKIEYQYYNASTYEHLLSSIYYTSNNKSATLAPYLMIFSYEDRQDKEGKYIAGAAYRMDKLLTKIDIYDAQSNAKLKTYSFGYTWDGRHSLLQSVTETGTDGVSQFNALQFVYGNETNVFTSAGQTHNLLPAFDHIGVSNSSSFDKWLSENGYGQSKLIGDFNGDGISDVAEKEYWTYTWAGISSVFLKYINIKIKDPNSNSFSQVYSYNLGFDNIPAMIHNPSPSTIKAYRDENFQVADIDGDGADDIIIGIRTHYNGADFNHLKEFTTLTRINDVARGTANDPIIEHINAPLWCNGIVDDLNNPAQNIENKSYMYFADFDGDGMTDMLTTLYPQDTNPTPSGKLHGIQLTVFRKFDAATHSWIQASYFNEVNTGSLPFVNANSGYYNMSAHIGASFLASPINFNGGLKMEFMTIKGAYTDVFEISNSNGSFYLERIHNNGCPTEWHRTTLGDFNGDGNTDLLVRSASSNPPTWMIGYSTGKEFKFTNINLSIQPNVYFPTNAHFHPDNTIVLTADMNQDGLADITHINGEVRIIGSGMNTIYKLFNRMVVQYNNGDNTFSTQEQLFAPYSDSSRCITAAHQSFGDFNGDGKVDILYITQNSSTYITVGAFRNEYTLRAVRNGLGMVNKVEYLPLTTNKDPYHYAFSGNLDLFNNQWSINRVKVPLWTVHRIGRYTNSQASAVSEVLYRYENLYTLRDGRGILAFNVTFTHDLTTGAIKKAFNDSFAPLQRYLPVLTGTEEGYIVGSNYTILRRTDNFRRYPSAITGKSYAIQEFQNIKTDLQSGTQIITNTTFDNVINNNPIEIKTEYPGLFTTVKKIQYAPAADTRTTVPSRPQIVEEISTRQGAPTVTTKASYEYQNGHLKKQILHDGLPNAITTTYGYDNFGNTTSQTVTAAGVPSHTESYEYDPTHRFRTKTTNALLQAAHTEYDSHWGAVTKQIAFGGLTTQYEYDPFLRLRKTTFPEGYNVTENLLWEGGGIHSINNARYRKETLSPTQGKTKVRFNVFGQPLEEIGDLWNKAGIQSEYFKDISYDNVGRKVHETLAYGTNDATNVQNSYAYDPQGRLKQIDLIHNDLGTLTYHSTTLKYSYVAGNLKTETTKPSGAVIHTLTDRTGKVIESKDENGAVGFTYDSWGNQWKTTLSGVPVVTNTYNAYNLITEINDFSAGKTTYEYDALGRLIGQEDPLQQQTTLEYDPIGRKKTVSFPEGKLEYQYYNAPNHARGNQLYQEIRTDANGQLEEMRDYTYDNYGRVAEVIYTQDNLAPRSTSYGYDNFGRISNTTLSSGVNYTTEYNTGAVWRVMQNSTLIFEVKDINGSGQPLEILRGDGQTSTHTYAFGQLLRKQTPGYQDYELTMDWSKGLITRRRDHLVDRHEDFTYNALKLATATIGANGPMTPLPTQTQVYGGNSMTAGNIASKSDVGNFAYGGAHRPHYTNNAAGAIPTQRQDITYASYKRPLTITENGKEVRLEYGTDGERRVMRFYTNGTLQYTKHYLPDGVEIIRDRFGVVHTITPLPGADGVGAYVVSTDDPFNPLLATSNIYYPYTDHLGSITLLTEVTMGNVAVAHRQSFDPWGRRRNPLTWETDDNALPPVDMRFWLRGFTGHEHLDVFGLINMNARLYDPKLGRMLSPDVLVGAPNSPLGYNRYVYALNNPISNIDPTGNEFITLSAVLIGAAIGAAVAGTTYTLQTTTMQGGLQKNWNIGEFLKSTAIGAASGAVSGAIGSAFGQTGSLINEIGRAYAHGINGAVFSGLQGGDPLMGFVTSFASTGISHGIESAGVASLTRGVGGAAFNAGMGAAFSAGQGGDPWIGAAGSLIGYLANQVRQQRRGINPYGEQGESGTINKFKARYNNMSMNEVRDELGRSGPFNSQAGGPSLRYLEDPLHPGKYIDMRHFVGVGAAHGEMAGGLVEVLQFINPQWRASAFNKQDFWSNRLGQNFRIYYSAQDVGGIKQYQFINHVEKFLTNPNLRNEKGYLWIR